MKIQIFSTPRALPYPNVHEDSAVRVARWGVLDEDDQAPILSLPRLGFPLADLTALYESSLRFHPLEVCFTQILFERPTPGVTLRPGSSQPFMILARVVSNLEAERPDLVKSRLKGFVLYDDRTTSSLSEQTWLQNGHAVNHTVTPGRVGVYVARWTSTNRAQVSPMDRIQPLQGWVGPHPKGNQLQRLHAVDSLLDLEYYRRLLPTTPVPMTTGENPHD
jgi:hypothetical protein